jgi:steroid 5-alpha reductase family enzyme
MMSLLAAYGTVGVWHYTRHPNYFGYAAQW